MVVIRKNLISYIPGDVWPELWIIDCNKNYLSSLSAMIGMSKDSLFDVLSKARSSGKHNEFHEFAKRTGLPKELGIYHLCSNISLNAKHEFIDLISKVEAWLAG
jgi:hypothetical protein